MTTMKTLCAACAVFLMVPLSGHAEKADALKPLKVDYTNVFADNVNQSTVVTGNVVITRGTMILKSDRAEVKETPEGYRNFVLVASPGKLATFRQKRDGGPNLWVEGHAQRIEYDERADLIKLLSSAEIKQLEGQKVTQQMNSAFISYDSRKEVLLGLNGAEGADKPGQGRGSMTFEPRRAPGAAASSPASTSAPASAPAAGKQ